MKLSLKIVLALALVVILGVAALCLLAGNRDGSPISQKLNFAEMLEAADRMEVAAVGLGKIERSKMIEGRLYKNFVQLLHVNHFREVLPDSTQSECQTGARITLYKDTVALGVYRMTTQLDREDSSERVILHRLPKVNKFLKDVGVPFRGCKAEQDESSNNMEKPKALTVPKFKKRHGKYETDSSEVQQYEVDEDYRVYVIDDSVRKQVDVTMNLMNELIFPADTAIGTPLYELAMESDRAEIVFYCRDACKGETHEDSRRITLDSATFDTYRRLLKNPTIETFAGNHLPRASAVITLFKDSAEVVELWAYGHGFGNMDKHQRGKDFEQGGAWYTMDPAELDSLLMPLRDAAYK